MPDTSNPAIRERALNEVMRAFGNRLQRSGWLQSVGASIVGINGQTIEITLSGLMAAVHREGPTVVSRYFRHRGAGLPKSVNVPDGRTDPSAFNSIESRLTGFAAIALPDPGFP